MIRWWASAHWTCCICLSYGYLPPSIFFVHRVDAKCIYGGGLNPFFPYTIVSFRSQEAGSLKMNTALEYSTRVVQEGGRRCKKSTLNDLVHLTPLRIPLMNPPRVSEHMARGVSGAWFLGLYQSQVGPIGSVAMSEQGFTAMFSKVRQLES